VRAPEVTREFRAKQQSIAWLAPAFFTEVQTLIETPWSVATLDFVFPDTRGQRPADFETTCSAAPHPGS
jgi:hypothetical protein